MNDHTGPAPVPNKRVLRTMCRLSLACALVGLAVIIGGFIVLSTSVFDEMSAGANLVVPGDSGAMRDDAFIRSVLPVASAAGIIHLAGVIAGFVGRKHAEDRAELGHCALGVGVNAFFLGCAGIIPTAGIVSNPGDLVPLLVLCGAAVLSMCVSLFERFFSSAGATSVGLGVAGLLTMGQALLIGLFAILKEFATTSEDPFLPGLTVIIVCLYAGVPVGIAQLTGLIKGIRARRNADSAAERVLATWGIVLNVPLCCCVLFLPLVVLTSIS